MVSALNFQAGYHGFESRSGRDNFQTIITPSSYSTCPGLSIKWTGRRLVTDSSTKCARVIHESNAVQIHLHHSNRRCLYVPRVPGSIKNPHNNDGRPHVKSGEKCSGSFREENIYYYAAIHHMIITAHTWFISLIMVKLQFNHFPMISLWNFSVAMATKPRGRSI